MIEEKTRSLYLAQAELEESKAFLQNVLDSMTSAVIVTDQHGRITAISGSAERLTGLDEETLKGHKLTAVITNRTDPEKATAQGAVEAELFSSSGPPLPVLLTASKLDDENGQSLGVVCTATDISHRKTLEVQLRHAQRMESIGQLAAGVAHEINTPIQYVHDSAESLGEMLTDLLSLHETYQPLRAAAQQAGDSGDILAAIDRHEEEVEIDFVRTEGGKAVQRTLSGIDRVASIVKALKRFSHPGGEELAPANLNEILETTLEVARSEYRHVAELDLEFGAIPDVMCDRGDLGQVFINLVVNAAHAIADRQQSEGGGTGRISISTAEGDGGVLVSIADTGTGIPAEIQDRIFEPFFTTKEPGQGTGQGLSLAHNIVVAKHGGRLSFEVDPGVGTTFFVWLPARTAASANQPLSAAVS